MLLAICALLLACFVGAAWGNVYAVDFGREYFKVGIASADAARKGNPIDMVLNEESKRKTPSSVAVELDGVTHVGANALAHAKRRPEASISGFPWLIGDECPAGCRLDDASNEYICNIHNTDITQSELISYVADYITSILPLQTNAPALAVVPPYASVEASTGLITTLNNAQDVLDFSGTVTTIAGAAASYIMSAVRGQKDVAKAVIIVDSGGWETCIGSVFIDDLQKSGDNGSGNSNNVKQFSIEDGPSKCFPLAGKQIDEIIQKLIVKNSPIHVEERSLQGDAMKCKMTLSANDFCVVHMDDPDTGKHLSVRVTRAEMIEEAKSSGIVDQGAVSDILQGVISGAYGTKLGQVPVIFVGGNTRVPLIRDYLTSEVENANKITSKYKAELSIYGGVNNDEGIVLGATIIGATQYYNSRVKIYYKRHYRSAKQIYPTTITTATNVDNRPFIGINRFEKQEFETLSNLLKPETKDTLGEIKYKEATQDFIQHSLNQVYPVFEDNIECPTQKQVTLLVRPNEYNPEEENMVVTFRLADYINNGNDENKDMVNGAFSICQAVIPKKAFIIEDESSSEDEENSKKNNEEEHVNEEKEPKEDKKEDKKGSKEQFTFPTGVEYEVNLNLELTKSCLPLRPTTCGLYAKDVNASTQNPPKQKKGKGKNKGTSSEFKLIKDNIPVTCTNYSYNDVIKKQDNLSPLSVINKKDTRPLYLLNPAPGPRNIGNYSVNIRLNNQVKEIANLANEMIDEASHFYDAIENVNKWNTAIDHLAEIINNSKNEFKPSIARKISSDILSEMATEVNELYDYYTTLVGHPLRCNSYDKSQFLTSAKEDQKDTKPIEEKTYNSRLDALNDSMSCLSKAHSELKEASKHRLAKYKEVLEKLKNYMDRDDTEKKTLDGLNKMKQAMEKIKEDNLVLEKVCIDPTQAMEDYMKSVEEEEEKIDGILGSVKHTFWQRLFTKSAGPSKEELDKIKAKYEKEYKQCKSYNDDAKAFLKQRDAFISDLENDLTSLEEKRKAEDEFEGADDEFELKYTIDELQAILDKRTKVQKRIIAKYRTLK